MGFFFAGVKAARIETAIAAIASRMSSRFMLV
jgi:hypothetical protein